MELDRRLRAVPDCTEALVERSFLNLRLGNMPLGWEQYRGPLPGPAPPGLPDGSVLPASLEREPFPGGRHSSCTGSRVSATR